MSEIRVRPGASAGGLEATLARVLQVGTYLSIGLVAIGVALLIAGGGSPLDPGPALSLPTLLEDLAAARPAAFLWLGILGIIVTPGLRVALALAGFVRGGEHGMAVVAGLILVVVALGVFSGLVTG